MTAPADLATLIAACRANPAPLSDWEARFLADLAARGQSPTQRQREALERIAARAPLDFRALAASLAGRMGELARDLTGSDPTRRSRDEWRFRTHGSLAVMVSGPDRGSWFDHEAGTGGDALAMVAYLRRMPLRDAVAWAQGWLGGPARLHTPPTPTRPVAASPAPREASATGDLAMRLWREAIAVDAPGSLVPMYLAARGLTLPADAPLRFHPACPRGAERWPAMLSLMTDPATAAPCGLHRTFLARDGSAKASGEPKKAMLGHVGVIRLVPDEDVTLGLGIAEGVETSLAVMQRTGWAPVWAATSAGAIKSFPVLPGIESLTVFADADGAGIDAARGCCRRWADAGRDARILAPPGGDWDDMLPRGEKAAWRCCPSRPVTLAAYWKPP